MLSKAHCKNLIGDGLYRRSLCSTPDSNSLKTRKFIDAITSMMKFNSGTYHTFLEILRSFRAFEPIADKIEEQVKCSSTPSSPCKKPRKILPEFGNMEAADIENFPYPDSVSALNSKNHSEIKATAFFEELETQHQKPLEDLKKCFDDRVAQLKASHEREQKLKEEIRHNKALISTLKASLHHDRCEKEELQKALDDAEEKLNDALSSLKKSRTKSKVSSDKSQRRLSSVDGILSISKEHSPPGRHPPYCTPPLAP